jgi:hypothetical protein
VISSFEESISSRIAAGKGLGLLKNAIVCPRVPIQEEREGVIRTRQLLPEEHAVFRGTGKDARPCMVLYQHMVLADSQEC